MKIYGFLIQHEITRNSIWSADLTLKREHYPDPVVIPLADAPVSYSGRDFFSFADVRDDHGWIDVYRNTAGTKLTPANYFQEHGISCIAHLLCSVGKDPILVLLGDCPEAFEAIKGIQILDQAGFRKLLSEFSPAIKLTRDDDDTFTATTDSPADLYWETTGGILSNTRTKSGQTVTLTGAGAGAEVRVGWKYFANVVKEVL